MRPVFVGYDNRRGYDWSCLCDYAAGARELVLLFSEWAASDEGESCLARFKETCPILWQEACQVARIINISPMRVLAANAFYDTSRAHCGCTAFAIDHDDGPLHGHCLDWEVGRDVLSRNVLRVDVLDEARTTIFRSVGWPGFLGVFTGVAPGRFAVTLNAVWSEDEPSGTEPIGFVLRRVLVSARTFDQAVAALLDSPLYCDCLLLITGIRRGEMAVVERTPTRRAIRRGSDCLLVTNHYCVLEAGSSKPGYIRTGEEPFGEGSRERYSIALDRLSKQRPAMLESSFSLLGEAPFCHDRTILRTAMRASTGQLLAERVSAGQAKLGPQPAQPDMESRSEHGQQSSSGLA